MPNITIPKELSPKDDLVAVSRKEYEEFLALKKIIPVYWPTKTEIRALEKARQEFNEGRYIEWPKLKNELANHRRKSGGKTT